MSTNISKQKREDLIHKINAIRTFIANSPQDKNTGNLLNYLSELEKDINGKKYGLIFEEHRENIDNLLDTHTPVLTEDKSLFIDNGGDMNFLIEGDNLAALQLLEKTHKGKIDVIYIDPPYNTGTKDFIYDDKFVDKEDLFKHSKWLSFMNKRLKLAKNLLNSSGIVFISIDENELSQLNLLCNKIFGENNFINLISVKTKIAGVSGSFLGNTLQGAQEFILIYAKNKLLFKLGTIPTKQIELNQYIEDMKSLGKSWKYTSVLKYIDKGEYIKSFYSGTGIEIKLYRHDKFEIKSIAQIANEEFNGDIKKAYYKYANKIFRTTNAQTSIRTKVIENTADLDFDIISIVYTPNKGKNANKETRFYYKDKICNLVTWLKDVIEYDSKTKKYFKQDQIGTFWDDILYNNVTREGNIIFSNGKKPLQLVKRLIKMSSNDNSSILDFFAGSGTTGHAVMQLNKEDNGSRKYILCTNNQNNICRDITYKRLANVINGYGNNAPIKSSLKYYKVDYIPINKKMYYEYADELLKHVRELVELENGINFIHNEKIAIILTDDELSEFISNIDAFKNCETIYLGHDVLPSEEQEEAIKTHNINVNIIPDYYYRNLQEM